MSVKIYFDQRADRFTVLSEIGSVIVLLEGTRQEYLDLMANRAADQMRRSCQTELTCMEQGLPPDFFFGKQDLLDLLKLHQSRNTKDSEINKAVETKLAESQFVPPPPIELIHNSYN